MGSKSRSSNTSGATSSTMSKLSRGGVSNEAVAGMQQDLANKQMGSMLPIFAELVQNGQGMFGSNPMMNMLGGMFGQPMQVQTPGFLQDFFAKYNPPKPEQPQQQPVRSRFGVYDALVDNERFRQAGGVSRGDQSHPLQRGTGFMGY